MKVGIVGSRFVGATAGYALVMSGVGREVVLVDKNAARAEAEADDTRHVTVALPRLVGGQGVLESFPPPDRRKRNREFARERRRGPRGSRRAGRRLMTRASSRNCSSIEQGAT